MSEVGLRVMRDLTPQEQIMIEESGVCDACGHLDAFHNRHCCEFCMVPDCKCWWGRIGGLEEEEDML